VEFEAFYLNKFGLASYECLTVNYQIKSTAIFGSTKVYLWYTFFIHIFNKQCSHLVTSRRRFDHIGLLQFI